MSALTPPRADLRGGNQSDDSFATSRRILAPSTVLRLFAVNRQGPETVKGACTHVNPDPGSLQRLWCLWDVAFEAWLRSLECLSMQVREWWGVIARKAQPRG